MLSRISQANWRQCCYGLITGGALTDLGGVPEDMPGLLLLALAAIAWYISQLCEITIQNSVGTNCCRGSRPSRARCVWRSCDASQNRPWDFRCKWMAIPLLTVFVRISSAKDSQLQRRPPHVT